MEFVRLNGTNRASVSATRLRVVMTSELKELHCVKKTFPKQREKRKGEDEIKIKPVIPVGREHSGQRLIG